MNAAAFLLGSDSEAASTALLVGGEAFTHSDVREGASAVACALRSWGAAKGSPFLLVDRSSNFWVSSYLGTIAAGGVSVPLPVTVEPAQLGLIMQMTSAKGIFIGSGAFKRYSGVIPSGVTVFTDGPVETDRPYTSIGYSTSAGADAASRASVSGTREERARELEAAEVDERRDVASLMFTSGSTGVPRGVMVSHRNIIANTSSIIEYMELSAADRVMAFLPFHYCFGTSLLHTHLRVGGSLVVENSFLFPNQILKRMLEAKCTGIAGVPSHYQILLRNSALKRMTFPDLKWVQQAGGKLHDVFLQELREALPGTRIYVMYGQTEATARLSYLPPEMLDRKMGSMGKGIPGVKLRVVNAAGEPVAPGEVGEIVAQGDNVTLGYWRDPEGTALTFRDGRLHTGDLATVDKDGYIFVVDRAKDFIKCGGNRVGCRTIEDVLLRYPGMIELAAIPQFDPILGEAVCLCAVHREGEAVRGDFLRYCGQNLPWDQIPRSVHFLKELPRNFSGKIDKQALRRTYGIGGAPADAAPGSGPEEGSTT